MLQHSVLSYRIDLYLPRHKLAIEIYEKGHKVRDEYEAIERQKAIEIELDCEFIRINPEEKEFDVYVEIGKIYNHIIKSSKKLLIEKISKRLPELEFKSYHNQNVWSTLLKKYCHHDKDMQTYCLSCRERTDNIGPREVIMTNKVVRQSSKCTNCIAKNSRYFKLLNY